MWIVHNIENCEMVKTGKYKTSDSKPQEDGGNGQIKPFTSTLANILTNIREEEYLE